MSVTESLAIVALLGCLLAVHRPRVEAIFWAHILPAAASDYRTGLPPGRHAWYGQAVDLATRRARQQLRFLAQLEQVQPVARRLGIGRNSIREAFPPILSPAGPRVSDADLLDLPETGAVADIATVRASLGRLFEWPESPSASSPSLPGR